MDNKIMAIQTGAAAESRFISYLGIDGSKPQSLTAYRTAIRRLFQFFQANGITAPRRDDIAQYRAELLSKYKPATVSLYMTGARLFFQWTAQEGIYPNVAEHIKGAKQIHGFKKDYLTPDQARAVIATTQGSSRAELRDRAILLLMVTTGLRCIEVSRANIEDLRHTAGYTALDIQGKGHDGKDEYVKVAPAVENAINAYLATRQDRKSDAPLFTSESNSSQGSRLTTRSISRLVKNHMRTAGLDSDRLTAHSLRHTAATLNLLNGGTERETQQMLRHKNINTTMIYSHALDRAANASEQRIAAALGI